MFAVLYEFSVYEGFEDQFERSWEALTYEFRETHGGLGSCLHITENGSYIAYARWPDKETWKREKKIVNQKAMNLMKDSLQNKTTVTPLRIVKNLLN